MTAALLLAGCHADRVAKLERRVAERRAEVQELRASLSELRQELDKSPPRTASVRMDNDPPGFKLTTPLPAGKPGQPDVLLVSIDTLRADHLGTYGYTRDTSPFLDQLAAEGTLFEQAWSPASWTLPSHTTMLSGTLPVHHGAIDDHLTIPPDIPLLQETFQKAGWGTIGAVGTLFVSSRYGFERGFDEYTDFGIQDKAENNLSTVDADHVFHNALYFAQQQPAGKPLFLFTHVYDCHYQYDPPAPWNTKFDRGPQWDDEVYRNYHAYQKQMISKVQLDHQVAQYDEEIAFVDAMLEELVDTWRASGRELIVVVTADHGEEFGERGSWGHAHTLYPEQLHVPLIVNGPGVLVQRVPDRIGTEDIAPTVAALAGLPFPSAKDGHSRAPQVLQGTVPTQNQSARFADTSRFDTLVYRWHEEPYDLYVDLNEARRELYDLSADPGERRNVYKPNHEIGEKLFAEMTEFLGQPWTARANGMVTVVDGVLFGEEGKRENEAMEVSPGTKFSVQPGDAQVAFRPKGATADLGPWRPLGGSVPGAGCPLEFSGRFVVDTELTARTEEERAMLEQLGYLQGDEGGEDGGKVPDGRIPCR